MPHRHKFCLTFIVIREFEWAISRELYPLALYFVVYKRLGKPKIKRIELNIKARQMDDGHTSETRIEKFFFLFFF